MNTKQLYKYPRLNTVLSQNFSDHLLGYIEKAVSGSRGDNTETPFNIYRVFIDLAASPDCATYTGLDILNSEHQMNKQLKLLVGFIYSELEVSHSKKWRATKAIVQTFEYMAQDCDFKIQPIETNSRRVTSDVNNCIALYDIELKDRELLDYYKGWSCFDSNGEELPTYLATIYDAFGIETTKTIDSALNNYSRTMGKTTLRGVVERITNLFNELTHHCQSSCELNQHLRAEKVSSLFEKVFSSMLLKSNINGNCTKTFFSVWQHTVIDYTKCFVDTDVFETPLVPIITPKYRKPLESPHSFSIGGKLTEKATERYFSWIPLHVKDEQAISIISARINNEIEHQRIVSNNIIENLNEKYNRNLGYIKSGTVKPASHVNFQSYPIGRNHLENTVATFYHYGIAYKSQHYANFLGYKTGTNELISEINLPTTDTIQSFLYQLVIEHPAITPAWLEQWELFDKSGNQVGFRQSGKAWIAVSYKSRRGANLAQQTIILNDHSKYVIESLIKHTEWLRSQLKKEGNDDWRYMLIRATLYKGHRILNLEGGKTFRKCCKVESINEEQEVVINKQAANELSKDITLRNLRKACGIKEYLETKSIQSVSEKLGHKKANMDILETYLPAPLLNYFNDRWIRIFQNAILLEALEGLSYLIDALDFTEESLDEFLLNHKLKELPNLINSAKLSPVSESDQKNIESLDELKFSITTPLLQILIAIINLVESESSKNIRPVIMKWYESALFIINQFTLSSERTKPNIYSLENLYKNAVQNPIDIKHFKRGFVYQ